MTDPFAGRALALTVLLTLGLAVPARAQGPGPETAESHFEQGVKRYNLGRFQEAIVEFERAYDADPAPILLFNIAQSHRQQGNKERALFFYRRYLEQAPDAPNRPEVEQRMKDLAQSLEQEKDLKQRPPTEVARPDGGGSVVLSSGETPSVTTSAAQPGTSAAGTQATPWAVLAYVAPSVVSVPGFDLPVQVSVRIGGTYAFPLPSARLTVGVDGVLGFIPYDKEMGGHVISKLPGLLVTAAYMRDITPTVSIGGGLGAGVVWWTGLDNTNPFSGELTVDGAIPMPTGQAELRGTWAFRPDLFVVLAPAIMYSKPTSGLQDAISAVWRFDVNVGAGYRF